MIRLYHNPRCSKSRAAKEILEDKGVSFEVVEYLTTGLTEAQVEGLAAKLKLMPSEFTRKNEDEYKTLQPQTEREHILSLVKEPKLLQRPILELAETAVIGRPPEKIGELLI